MLSHAVSAETEPNLKFVSLGQRCCLKHPPACSLARPQKGKLSNEPQGTSPLHRVCVILNTGAPLSFPRHPFFRCGVRVPRDTERGDTARWSSGGRGRCGLARLHGGEPDNETRGRLVP